MCELDYLDYGWGLSNFDSCELCRVLCFGHKIF